MKCRTRGVACGSRCIASTKKMKMRPATSFRARVVGRMMPSCTAGRGASWLKTRPPCTSTSEATSWATPSSSMRKSDGVRLARKTPSASRTITSVRISVTPDRKVPAAADDQRAADSSGPAASRRSRFRGPGSTVPGRRVSNSTDRCELDAWGYPTFLSNRYHGIPSSAQVKPGRPGLPASGYSGSGPAADGLPTRCYSGSGAFRLRSLPPARRSAKNARISSVHFGSSTPPATSTRWFRRGDRAPA